MTNPLSTVQFVIKTTKFCNLRCSYCYEFDELDDKRRMSLDQLAALFRNIRPWLLEREVGTVEFIWHGGEPLLVPIDFYRAAHELEAEIFGTDIGVSNLVQSNLTVLTDRHIEFFKTGGFFNGLGVSFDVYGDARVDVKGRPSTDKVLGHMQDLVDNGIVFGAICVLARNTLGEVRNIYRFFDRLGVQSRFLPFFETGFGWQEARHALTNPEIVGALVALFDEWAASDRATRLEPVNEFVTYAVRYLTGGRAVYDRRTDENIFVVNLGGGVWGSAEHYDPNFMYGNLFHERLEAVLSSPGREKAIVAAEQRQARYCATCPYFGACPGLFVASGMSEQTRSLTTWGCPLRDVLDVFVDRLRHSDIADDLAAACLSSTDRAVQISL